MNCLHKRGRDEEHPDTVIKISAGSRQVHRTFKWIEAMDEEFLINIVMAGKKYPFTIKRHEEELACTAADQISSKILQYRQRFAVEVNTKDLLAMAAFQLSMHDLELEKRNDTNPFTDKIQELATELEGYLKK